MNRVKNIMKLANEKRLMQIRGEALYCDMINKKFAREILLFARESFDDNLVGYSKYSNEISDITDKIFEEIVR